NPFIVITWAGEKNFMRRPDDAIMLSRKALEIDPQHSEALHTLGMAFALKGQYADALDAFEKVKQMEGTPWSMAFVAYAHGLAGDKVAAGQILEELKRIEVSKARYVDPYLFAIIYLSLGDKEQTCTWLEKSHAERSSFLVGLKVDPIYDSILNEPRFV